MATKKTAVEQPKQPETLSEMAKAADAERLAKKEPLAEPKVGTRVRALTAGFYGGARRRAGQVFTLKPGDKPGSWMQLVTE